MSNLQERGVVVYGITVFEEILLCILGKLFLDRISIIEF